MPIKNKKTGKTTIQAMFGKVDYDIKPIQKEAVWPGVLNEDTMWCFPKEESYKKRVRAVFKNYGVYKSKAEKLQKYIVKMHDTDAIYRQYAELFGMDEENAEIMDWLEQMSGEVEEF